MMTINFHTYIALWFTALFYSDKIFIDIIFKFSQEAFNLLQQVSEEEDNFKFVLNYIKEKGVYYKMKQY